MIAFSCYSVASPRFYVFACQYVQSAPPPSIPSELQRLDSIARSPIQSHFAETQSGLAVIRAYRYQSRFFAALLQAVDMNLLTSLLYECGQRWLGIALVRGGDRGGG